MDQSPTALFDSYEQDFQGIIAAVRQKLDGDAKDARGGESAGLVWRPLVLAPHLRDVPPFVFPTLNHLI
jgi:hypothetical protein